MLALAPNTMPLANKPSPVALDQKNPFPPGDAHQAYECCLWLEGLLGWPFAKMLPTPQSAYMMQAVTSTVAARTLGYALIYACDAGREATARDILSCEKKEELLAGLSYLYIYGLICVGT